MDANKSAPEVGNINAADIKTKANGAASKSVGVVSLGKELQMIAKMPKRHLEILPKKPQVRDQHSDKEATSEVAVYHDKVTKQHKSTQTNWKQYEVKVEPNVLNEMMELRQHNSDLQDKYCELQQKYTRLQSRQQNFATLNMQQAAFALQSSAELRLMNQQILENTLALDQMLQEDYDLP